MTRIARTSLRLDTQDGLAIEAVRSDPADRPPVAALVFCHPHPLHGGTMHAPLLTTIERTVVAAGASIVRFNFRGVGASEGGHDNGEAERLDLSAAVAAAPGDIPLVVGGWSFGGGVSLQWFASHPDPEAWVGVAPAVFTTSDVPPDPLHGRPALLLVGDREQILPTQAVESLADALGPSAELVILEGCDHFFIGKHADNAASAIARFVAGCAPE